MLVEASDRSRWKKRLEKRRDAITLLLVIASASGAVALWVTLTALTGKTYHLAPAVAAMAPAGIAWLRGARPRQGYAVALLGLGLMAAASGWAVIAGVGIEPSATIIDGQPGGVLGEVIVAGLAGAALGGALLARQRQGPHA